jgi:hypothetical protein
MATNAIGKGTVNVQVVLTKGERGILGRLALEEDQSVSDFARRRIVDGMRMFNPKAAEKMEELRRKHKEQLLLNL